MTTTRNSYGQKKNTIICLVKSIHLKLFFFNKLQLYRKWEFFSRFPRYSLEIWTKININTKKNFLNVCGRRFWSAKKYTDSLRKKTGFFRWCLAWLLLWFSISFDVVVCGSNGLWTYGTFVLLVIRTILLLYFLFRRS